MLITVILAIPDVTWPVILAQGHTQPKLRRSGQPDVLASEVVHPALPPVLLLRAQDGRPVSRDPA
jgi:hypothetical protein